MPNRYNYFHITINPKNCDGSSRQIDFLSNELISELDKYLIDISKSYARAIESNKDKLGHHYHFVLFAKQKLEKKILNNHLKEIISHHYLLSEDSDKYLLYVKHKTKKQAEYCAGGYLTKQFNKNNQKSHKYISNIPDDILEKSKSEYETLVESKAEAKFSEWVLDTDRDTLLPIEKLGTFYKAIQIILQNDKELKLNCAEDFKIFYPTILHKYKLSYQYGTAKKFNRQILEFIISNGKYEKIDYETLVNFIKFSKSDEYMNIIDENQYEQNTILNYWAIN